MYITYISTAPTKQCLEFDTWLHWCVVINAFLIADRNDWFLTFMLDLEPAEVNGSPRRLHPKSIRSTTHKKQWQLFLSQPLWLVHWVKRQTGTPGNRFYKFYDTKWEPLIIRYKPKDNDEVQSRYIFFSWHFNLLANQFSFLDLTLWGIQPIFKQKNIKHIHQFGISLFHSASARGCWLEKQTWSVRRPMNVYTWGLLLMAISYWNYTIHIILQLTSLSICKSICSSLYFQTMLIEIKINWKPCQTNSAYQL